MATAEFLLDMQTAVAKFQADTNAMVRQTQTMARRMEGSFRNVGGAVGGALGSITRMQGLIAGLAAGGIAVLVQRSIEAADNIAKMSQRVGVGVEALQELQHAASLSGVAVSELENGLRFLNQRIGEALGGNKDAASFFTGLGIALRDTEGRVRDAGVVIDDLADKIAATRDPVEQTRIATEAFGSRMGTRLIPMLREGSAGLAEMREEARRLGLVIDAEMVRQAERANDQFDRMAKAIQTSLVRAVVTASPVLISLSETIASLTIATSKFVESFIPAEALIGVDALQRRLEQIDKTIEGLEAGKAFAKKDVRGRVLEMLGLDDPRLANADQRIRELQEERRRVVDAMERTRKIETVAAPEVTVTAASEKDIEAWVKSWTDGAEAIVREYEEELAALRKIDQDRFREEKAFLDQGLRDRFAAIDAETEAYEEGLRTEYRLQQEAVRRDKDALDESLRNRLAAIDEEIAAYEEGLRTEARLRDEAFQAQREKFDEIADAISGGITTSLNGVIAGTQTAAQAFDNMAQSIVLSITNTVIRKGLDVLSDKLFDIIRQLAQIGVNSLGSTATTPTTTGGVGQVIEPVPGGAKGAVVRKRPGGRLMVVGEGGQDEGIFPLDRLEDFIGSVSGGGGGTVVQIIDQRGSGSIQREERTSEDGRRVVRLLIRDEVGRAIRDGALDRVLGGSFGVTRRPVSR
jgi:hypothetical protein